MVTSNSRRADGSRISNISFALPVNWLHRLFASVLLVNQTEHGMCCNHCCVVCQCACACVLMYAHAGATTETWTAIDVYCTELQRLWDMRDDEVSGVLAWTEDDLIQHHLSSNMQCKL